LAKSARADKTAERYSIEASNGQERKAEWKILKAPPRQLSALRHAPILVVGNEPLP